MGQEVHSTCVVPNSQSLKHGVYSDEGSRTKIGNGRDKERVYKAKESVVRRKNDEEGMVGTWNESDNEGVVMIHALMNVQ